MLVEIPSSAKWSVEKCQSLLGCLGRLGGLGGLLGLGGRSGLGGSVDADEDLDRGGDVTIELDGHVVSTDGLDRGTMADTLLVDVEAELGLDGFDDLGRGDGAKELALITNLGVNGNALAVESRLERLGVGDALCLALLDAVTTLLELLDVARGGGGGDLVGEQVVLRESLSDVYDVALSAIAPKLTQEDDFHGKLLRSVGLGRLLLTPDSTRPGR